MVAFLTKRLAGTPGFAGQSGNGGGGGVFCYVNSVFAPGLDEGVGGLWRVSCFSNYLVGGGERRWEWGTESVEEGEGEGGGIGARRMLRKGKGKGDVRMSRWIGLIRGYLYSASRRTISSS